MKYFEIHFTKEMKDLHREKLIFDEKNTNKWKYIPYSWFRNIVKMSILPKVDCKFSEIPVKNQMTFLQK